MAGDLDYAAKNYETPLAKEESLICEALVKEMGRATRWSAVLDVFNTLGHVRLMAANMHREAAQMESGVAQPVEFGVAQPEQSP